MKTNFTESEINHLLSLLQRNEVDGTYCMPYKQYWDRHKRILDKLIKAKAEIIVSKIDPSQIVTG